VFGCSLFSVTDILPKLASFKASLRQQNLEQRPLYFAKVDVQTCFDTIPQARLLSMVESLMSMQAYQTGRHVEISPLGALQRLDGQHVDPLPIKRYVPHSGGAKDMIPFQQLVEDKFVGVKSNTVFVNTNLQQQETKDDLMRLLREHVERNLVKIGKKFYRQKKGIPQGSILSTILCNFFYAELERDILSFALGPECLLLRLLDDFLLITVNQQQAERFVRVMHRGHAEYGVVVKPSKSLTNFDVFTDDGHCVPKAASNGKFYYCGVCIDTETLDVSKKFERATKIGEWQVSTEAASMELTEQMLRTL
jgi:telomerase reverse transcriptase